MITKDLLDKLKSSKDEKDTEEAAEAVKFAGEIINAILSGKQIDPVYMSLFIKAKKEKINKRG